MKPLCPILFALSLLAACGKSDKTPAPAPAPPSAPGPAPATGTATEPDAAAGAAAADATSADAPPQVDDTTAAEAAAPAVADGAIYLVWTYDDAGAETAWIKAAADGQPEVVATRRQAVGVYGGALWAFEQVHLAFREYACEDADRDAEQAKPRRLRYLPELRARTLAGADPEAVKDIARHGSTYFDDSKAQEDSFALVGEHWGRQTKVVGGGPDKVLVIDCEGAFSCGAHGDSQCEFRVTSLVEGAPAFDLAAVAKAIEADAKETLDAWTKEPDLADMGAPALTAIELVGNGGDPLASYLFVGEVPYAASRGDWSSYTASKTFVGKLVPELGLGEVPAVVKRWLATRPKEVRFGWSTLAADAPAPLVEDLKKAFNDASTLPEPAPKDEVIGDAATPDVDTLVRAGRKLTQARQYAEAIATFDKAIAASDTAASAWSERGYAKLLAGDLEAARTDLQKALELKDTPKFQAAVHFNLGEIAEKSGDAAGAIEHYRKAYDLGHAEAAKKRLDKLKANGPQTPTPP